MRGQVFGVVRQPLVGAQGLQGAPQRLRAVLDVLDQLEEGIASYLGVKHAVGLASGTDALMLALRALDIGVGDEVIIPEPFYANYNGFAVAAGVKVVPITSHIENGFALPPIADFEKVITDKTSSIVVCNPNNPTGYLYCRA